ncbi:hypothetical protein K7X08_028648 [Anisodus acutangulus]|uniref:Uncharacterized protein n=1 Tax=Anisodus acutangulus TaxID=402998 RepID=A0A9Q1LT92_9SOLA|nr:hypothetical protein K7X08_028648 [Anisodus acutangulus]
MFISLESCTGITKRLETEIFHDSLDLDRRIDNSIDLEEPPSHMGLKNLPKANELFGFVGNSDVTVNFCLKTIVWDKINLS